MIAPVRATSEKRCPTRRRFANGARMLSDSLRSAHPAAAAPMGTANIGNIRGAIA
jgi:hypothetical protein